jgi:serine/threonine protein kinase
MNPGETVNHYRVEALLGGGGMGIVYLSEDLRLGRKVALKFLHKQFAHDATALERFRREWSRDGKHLAIARSKTSTDIVLFRGLRPKP